ncbi:MAG: proline--tRNA ligase [Candidatus Nomurabacteria bacterium]|jgi:prolyl-tRNA synthetase|nr:proline--tRNA ligase [Candidatus Nomurabacteria bacterium]
MSNQQNEKNLLPKKTGDLSDWYVAINRLADLSDYGPAKGTMIFKPYGYAIWENIQRALDDLFKEHGVENAYFPMLFPMSYLEREKDHVDGFSPELAVVTHGGGEKLEEPLVVRPTSESIMYDYYAKWTQSWRDLPILINQWNNIVRWEKRTMPFIRTSEFLWQEGHTAHATAREALDTQKWAMDVYRKVYREVLAIDGYSGLKSAAERFAGAEETLTFETMMPSMKALQSCTSHYFGQKMARAFNLVFQNQAGDDEYAYQTSWGFSTRSIGGLILAHGDDNGLRLPPRVAPIQVVIVPVKTDDEVLAEGRKIFDELKKAGVRVKFDERDYERFGYKLNDWEVKGVPVIIKLGAKEITDGVVSYRRRDTLSDGQYKRAGVASKIIKLIDTIQADMLTESVKFRDENTYDAADYDEFKRIMADRSGFIKVHWNEDTDIEMKIKEETKATTRCKLAEQSDGVDFYTGQPAKDIWLFAQSY